MAKKKPQATTSQPVQHLPPGKVSATAYKVLYDKFLPISAQIPEDKVQACRANVRVALVNIKLGIQGVCGSPEQIAAVIKHLPQIPIQDVLELPDIGRALFFANSKVITRPASPKEIEKALQEISGPREQMLSMAEILAAKGKLNKDRVAKIRSGGGKFDMAEDGVALADMFTEEAAELKGLHPFTVQEIEKLRKTSEWLVDTLNPAGGRSAPRKKTPAEDARDRFWTLSNLRHPFVRKIGYYFHGDAFEEVTPKLLSRVQEALLKQEIVEEEGVEEEGEPEDTETTDPEDTPPK